MDPHGRARPASTRSNANEANDARSPNDPSDSHDESPVVLDRVTTPRGELVLRRSGADFEVISNGMFLMDTRDGRSERLLVVRSHRGTSRSASAS